MYLPFINIQVCTKIPHIYVGTTNAQFYFFDYCLSLMFFVVLHSNEEIKDDKKTFILWYTASNNVHMCFG